jgi:hypothetical protein
MLGGKRVDGMGEVFWTTNEKFAKSSQRRGRIEIGW